MSIIITRELPKIVTPELREGDHRKDCCQIPTNLEYHEWSPGNTCLKCRRCGCRHFDMDLSPGKYGLKL